MEDRNEVSEEVKNKQKAGKVIITIVAIFVFISLILIKIQVESFPFFWVIFGGVVSLGSIFVIWKGFDWYRSIKELKEGKLGDGKLPPPITIEQAKEIIKEIFKSPEYADVVTGWKKSKIFNAGKDGKSRILAVHLETLNEPQDYLYIIINMHYPREMYSIFSQDKDNPSEVIKAVNSLAISPIDEPDIEKTISENTLTGTKIITEKQTHKKKDKKDDKKEEDLSK